MRPLFWKLHIGGWLLYGLGMYAAGAAVLGWWPALLHKIPFISLGFLITLGLRALYKRFWRRRLSFPQIVGLAIVASYVFAQVWAVCFNLTYMLLLDLDFEKIYWYHFIRGSMNYTFVFVSWSALYFSIKHYQELQAEQARSEEATTLAQEAQLQMLRYQLNPHFLFNALNSIHALIREDQARAEQMLDELAEFLRYSLVQDKGPTVPLRDELAVLRRYLDIEQIRFEDKLDVQFEVDPAATDIAVPSFLLHPLVENAVKHGMATSTLPLRLRLAATQQDETLRIAIANTGSLHAASGDGAPPSTGTGLANVRARLARRYPNRHAFFLREQEGWVEATIEITPVA